MSLLQPQQRDTLLAHKPMSWIHIVNLNNVASKLTFSLKEVAYVVFKQHGFLDQYKDSPLPLVPSLNHPQFLLKDIKERFNNILSLF